MKLDAASKVLGYAVAPVIGLVEGAFEHMPEDSTTGQRIANTFGGALKEADDALVMIVPLHPVERSQFQLIRLWYLPERNYAKLIVSRVHAAPCY